VRLGEFRMVTAHLPDDYVIATDDNGDCASFNPLTEGMIMPPVHVFGHPGIVLLRFDGQSWADDVDFGDRFDAWLLNDDSERFNSST